MSEASARVLEIVAGVVDRPGGIRPEHKLKGDLDLDSTEAMDLLATLEEEFDIEIGEVEASKFETVADLIAKVEGR